MKNNRQNGFTLVANIIKYIVFLTSFAMLYACGGGGGGSSPTDNPSDNDVNTSPPPYVSSWVYPYTDKILFGRESEGDLIALSDLSLWFIRSEINTGLSVNGYYTITLTENDVYNMTITGHTTKFGVEPIYGLDITVLDSIPFGREATGDLLELSDGRLWTIVGTHRSTTSLDVSGTHNITIYANTTPINVSYSGEKSDYYMNIIGSNTGFYLAPIDGLVIIAQDRIPFSREDTGDVITLMDGTQWKIVGTHSSGNAVSDIHDLTIYTNTNVLSVSLTSGRRSDYYMSISCSSRGFFIEPL